VASADIRPERIAERIDRLHPLTVFSQEWMALTQGGGVEQANRLSLVGIPSHMESRRDAINKEIFRQGRETSVETIGDDDQVLMVHQQHGFPLFAIAEIAACRRAYDADVQSKPLRFTLPEQEARTWSIEPADAAQSHRWFALALALGYIERVGTDYVYREPTNGYAATEHELVKGEMDRALGRERARDEFLRRGFASALDASWKDEVRRVGGNEPMYQKLSAWVAAERARTNDPSYTAEFRKDLELVQEFAESIRP
jgi:hypothetical protein